MVLEKVRSQRRSGFFRIFTVDPQLNVDRVASRVPQGGHDVPVEKIISRYWKSRALLPELIEICDICHVYDNTDEKPVRIVRKHKQSLLVFPNEYWTEEELNELIKR